MHTIHEKPDDLQPVMETFQRSPLGKIIQKAKYLLALDHALQKILPADFVNYCHVMNLHQNTVILGVNSAAIATRIQFITPELIQKLQQQKEFQTVNNIHCRVQMKT